jgi:hypothetical protein
MCPPPCHGGMASSNGALPYNAPMPVGPKTLCAEKNKEIGVERGDIDWDMRRGLRSVHEHRDAAGVRQRDDFFDGIDRSQRIGNVPDGDNLRPRSQQLCVFFENQLAAIIDRDDADDRASLFSQQLPRDDVGVMFQLGQDDLIARADVFAAVTLRNQVDTLGRAADENDFLGRRGCPRNFRTFSRAPSNKSVERTASACAARWMFELSRE